MTHDGGFNRISLTAHYTSYVWAKNDPTADPLKTRKGWLLYHLARPVDRLVGLCSRGENLEAYLVRRRRMIDQRLAQEIESGRITQVIELAAGLSPRGETFLRRYRKSHGLIYIESDLPNQIRLKETLLRRNRERLSEGHHFVSINVASETELESQTRELLDHTQGCAVVSEGLLSYLDTPLVYALWPRIARMLQGFPQGAYISDLHLGGPAPAFARLIRRGIELAARGRLGIHCDGVDHARRILRQAGFAGIDWLASESALSSLGVLHARTAD